jgi:hypothetical protein
LCSTPAPLLFSIALDVWTASRAPRAPGLWPILLALVLVPAAREGITLHYPEEKSTVLLQPFQGLLVQRRNALDGGNSEFFSSSVVIVACRWCVCSAFNTTIIT